MAITVFADVEAFVKRDIPASDQTWVESKITEAEALLETYIGDADAWIAADPNPPKRQQKFILAVCRMVERVFKNPDGYSTETDGDYSYGRASVISSGEVYASRTDLRLLGLGRRRRLRTINTKLPSDSPRNIAYRDC